MQCVKSKYCLSVTRVKVVQITTLNAVLRQLLQTKPNIIIPEGGAQLIMVLSWCVYHTCGEKRPPQGHA